MVGLILAYIQVSGYGFSKVFRSPGFRLSRWLNRARKCLYRQPSSPSGVWDRDERIKSTLVITWVKDFAAVAFSLAKRAEKKKIFQEEEDRNGNPVGCNGGLKNEEKKKLRRHLRRL